MKKIFLFLLILISIRSFGQYPALQNIGADSTLVVSKGGLKGRIIVWAFTDTTAANATRIRQYPYALIATGDHSLYIRNIDASVWVLIGTGSGTGGPDTIYVKGRILTVDRTTNPGHQTLGTNELDGLKSGGIVTSAGGLSVGVTVADYIKNFTEYISPEIVLTAVADPSLPRKYLVVVDTFGVASLLAGTPATNPIEPSINPATQIRITEFDVPAGATTLNINTVVIYDETGGTEYDTSSSGAITSSGIDIANPAHGTNDYYISKYSDGAQKIFTKSSGTDTVFTNSLFKGFFYSNGAFLNHISMQLFLSGVAVSSDILLDPFINALDSNVYQILAVPRYAFGGSGNIVYDQIKYTFHGNDLSGAKGLYLDYLQLQTGLTNSTNGRGILSITKNAAGDSTITTLQDGTVIEIFDRGGGAGGVTSVTGTSPINSSGGSTPAISITTADATHAGAISSTDWNTFNGKLSNITGYITPGTGVTFTGSGTSGSPYVVNATASGGGTDSTKQSSAPWIVAQQVFNTASPSMSSSGTATFTYTTGGLSISGGDGTFNNLNQITSAYSFLEDYQIDLGPFVSTIAGAGIAIGINCTGSEFAIVKADLTSGGTKGQLSITRDKTTYPYLSATNLSYSSGDSLMLRIVRSKFSVQAYFTNLSTGLQVSTSFDLTQTSLTGTGPNVNRSGRPAIWALGGTQTFTSNGVLVYRTSSYRKPKLVIVGTSIETGYKAVTAANRWPSLKYRALFPYTVLAMASATTTDVVNALPELVLIHPEYAAFTMIVNDTIQHFTNATTQSNITTINNTCIANGIKPIWISGLPLDALFSSYNAGITRSNTFIQTLTGITKYVNFNANVPIITVDGVHPDSTSHSALAQYFIDNTSDLFTYSPPLNFSDSLRRVALNVQQKKNGVWTTQYTDSIGPGWNTAGNTFSDSLNFIGTLTTTPLQFRYNNTPMGGIYGVLTSIWMGSYPHSGVATSAALQNSFYGWNAGGTVLTTANGNTGVGSSALSSLTTATDITAIGKNSLVALTTGVRNVGVGVSAFQAITSGTDNVGLGWHAGNNNTGSANVAIGGQTVNGSGSGSNNTAVGVNAGGSNTSGGSNLYLGNGAGFNNATLSNWVFINSLLKNNLTEDTTNSVFLALQSGTFTSQRTKIGGGGLTGINTYPKSTLDVNGSFGVAYVAKATSYTATVSDYTIEVTATGQTITLPTAVGISGREYVIKLTASGSATVATTSSQTIDGSTTYSLSAQYKYVTVQSNNANWLIIANN